MTMSGYLVLLQSIDNRSTQQNIQKNPYVYTYTSSIEVFTIIEMYLKNKKILSFDPF